MKPGADITPLTSSVTEETKSRTLKDILVFRGGANDVSRNDSQEGLRKLTKFVEVNSNTNIILLCVPHRHDLPSWSCVNNEIAMFNRKLNKIMKSYKHVKVLKTGLDRNLFTRQGMRMDSLGKQSMALEMPNEATKILSKQEKVISVTITWKKSSLLQPESSTSAASPAVDVNRDLGQLCADEQGSKIALTPRSPGGET